MTNSEVPQVVDIAGITEDTTAHVTTRIKIRKRRTMLRMTRRLVDVARRLEVAEEVEVVDQARVEVSPEVRNQPNRTAMASRMAVLMMQRRERQRSIRLVIEVKT
jgi:hypothetical protein